MMRSFLSTITAHGYLSCPGSEPPDPHIPMPRPVSRSILCTPVLRQGRLVAVLYLENNLAANAFTPDRIELMQVLAKDPRQVGWRIANLWRQFIDAGRWRHAEEVDLSIGFDVLSRVAQIQKRNGGTVRIVAHAAKEARDVPKL